LVNMKEEKVKINGKALRVEGGLIRRGKAGRDPKRGTKESLSAKQECGVGGCRGVPSEEGDTPAYRLQNQGLGKKPKRMKEIRQRGLGSQGGRTAVANAHRNDAGSKVERLKKQ